MSSTPAPRPLSGRRLAGHVDLSTTQRYMQARDFWTNAFPWW
jgi:hypothetical protein